MARPTETLHTSVCACRCVLASDLTVDVAIGLGPVPVLPPASVREAAVSVSESVTDVAAEALLEATMAHGEFT